MSERDRNNEDREYRRREREDRGFFEQARDWIRGERDEDEDRQRNREEQNYDRGRQWRGARYYDQGQSSGQDYSRDYQDPRDYRDQPVNRDRNDYARGRRYFGQGYGQNYSQRDPNRDEQGYRGREHFRYSRTSGSPQDDSEFRDQQGFRDHREDDDYADEGCDFRRRGYNEGLSRGHYGDPTNRSQSDWDFDEQMRRTYGSEESGRETSRRSGRPYPSAGMRSDFGSDYNYENEYGEDRWIDRGRSGTFDYNSRFEGTGRFPRGGGRGPNAGRFGGRDFRDSDYIGYDREGAFYQDLDEPYSFEYWEIWMVPGEFTGMGPANYQRSDERIQEEVCERLTRHGRVDASQIEIDVKDGEVTLRGQAHSRDMKRMAEDTAEGVTGVKTVHNEIRVPKRPQDMRSQDMRSTQEQQWQRAREISSGDYNRDNQDWNRDRQASQMDTSRYEANREGLSGSTAETGGSSQVDSNARVTGQQSTGPSMTGQQTTGSMTGSHTGMQTGAQRASRAAQSTHADQVSPESSRRLGLHPDMEVIGKNGKVIGRVKEIRASDFLVDREMARDLYVPMDALESVGAAAMLKYGDDEIDNQDWEKPDIL